MADRQKHHQVYYDNRVFAASPARPLTELSQVLEESSNEHNTQHRQQRTASTRKLVTRMPECLIQPPPPVVTNQNLPLALKEPEKNAQLLQAVQRVAQDEQRIEEELIFGQSQPLYPEQYGEQNDADYCKIVYSNQMQAFDGNERQLIQTRVSNVTADWRATGAAPLPPPMVSIEPLHADGSLTADRARRIRADELARELAELRETQAQGNEEVTLVRQRPFSPYETPAKINLAAELQTVTSRRPESALASRRSASRGVDLLDKEAQLWHEITLFDQKPYNSQQLVLGRDATVGGRQSIDASLQHHYSRAATLSPRPASAGGVRRIDNKSPLPFSFDNFTTKGVRGNIATAGAIEPERPYAPIYPIIRQTRAPCTPTFAL